MITLAKFRKFLKLLFDREVPTTNEPVKKAWWSHDCSTSYVSNLWDYRPSPLQSGSFFSNDSVASSAWAIRNHLKAPKGTSKLLILRSPTLHCVAWPLVFWKLPMVPKDHDHKNSSKHLSPSLVCWNQWCAVMQRKKYTAWVYMSLHGVYLGLLASDDLFRYGLPLKVIEILVAHFCAFATEDRVLPLVPWPVDEGWLQNGHRGNS